MAELIIPSVGNNRLRHEHLQQFILANNSTTLAVEGPSGWPARVRGAGARAWHQLQDNIRDAVALYVEDENPSALGFSPRPSILTNFEVPPPAYAGRP